MKELVIDGKKYQKASEVARNLGYTSDYVGQLCRSGKVSAQQIGRSWYVQVDSIHAHKKTRYRSNETKSRQAVQEYKQAQEQKPEPKHSASVRHIAVSHYEADETDLIPGVARHQPEPEPEPPATPKPAPKPAAKTEVSVASVEKKARKFRPAEKPHLQFSGTVQVAEAETDNPTPDVTPAATTPIAQREQQSKSQPQRRPRRGQAVAVQDESAEHSPVAVTRRAGKRPRRRGYWVVKPLVLLILLGGTFVVTHGLQRSYQYEGDSVVQMYSFDTQLFTENIPKNIVILFNR